MGLQPEGTPRAKDYLIPLALPDMGALLESFADAALLIDAETFRILGWNRRLLEQYEIRPDEPVRRQLVDLFARESRLELKNWLHESAPVSLSAYGAMRNGRKQRFSLTAHRLNHYHSTVFLLFFVPQSERSDQDTAIKMDPGNADMAAALQESEANLVVQKAYLEKLIESAPEAIVIVSDQNVILRANCEFERLFGYSRDEVLGRQLDPLIVPPQKMQESQVLTEFSSRGESAALETVRQRRDGSLVDVSFLVTPINIGNGQIAYYCIYRDITEWKRDQEALQHSEEHFRSLVESSSDAIVILSPEGVIRYQNPSVARLLGYNGEEVIGQDAFSLIHPEDLAAAVSAFEYTLKNSRLDQPVELRLRAKDGEWRPVEVVGSRLRKTGNDSGLVVSCRDLSERRKTERALLESEAKFRAVAEMATTVIYILNESGKWIYMNPAAERVFEYSREEMLGRSPAMIIHPDHKEEAAARARARFKGWENSDHYELKVITKSGKVRWLDYSAILINFGGERAILGTAHDITELKRNELLQRALYRISEQASSAEDLDRLYHSIHEIIGELMEARNFYIALWDPASERITFPYLRDDRNTPPPQAMLRSQGLTGYVLRTGQPLLATAEVLKKLVEAGELDPAGPEPQVWLGVPLRFGGSVIGVLALQSYDAAITYGEQEKYILTFVSQHVASALRRKRHEDALRESESRYRSLVQSAVHGMYYSSIDDRFEYVNQALVKMLGYDSEEEVLRLKLSTDLYVDPEERRQLVEKHRNSTEVRWAEVSWKRKDGKVIQVRAAGRTKVNEKGEATGFEMIVEDLAERRMLEEQLRQSQKMEAVGRLAGGIAHDFNNLLTVIKGYSELILNELKQSDDPLRLEAEEIKKAADRAVALVRQLLAFSRRQVLTPKVIDLNALVSNMDNLLRPLLREDIHLRAVLQPNLGKIKADPGQIEQVIMNLAVNARDAMPRGGKLTIETLNVELDPNYVREHAEMTPGAYVMLAVSDNGIGMDETTRLRVFEPFFTTKETGKGTGLGLSTVYGIVKQSGGYVWVYSEPGHGTTFKIYLPRVDAQPDAIRKPESAFASYRGTETVLLLEDEDGVRALMRHMLHKQGYTVLEAKRGHDAIHLCRDHQGPIHLLLADVVLEQMSGREVAEQLSMMRPEMKTLYISGYTDDAIVHHGVLSHEMPFLQKPFTAEGLIKKVRLVIEGNLVNG